MIDNGGSIAHVTVWQFDHVGTAVVLLLHSLLEQCPLLRQLEGVRVEAECLSSKLLLLGPEVRTQKVLPEDMEID